MMQDISPIIREKAPFILAEIKKAKKILLHCHPSPDPDSVGSALAMKFALEQMGKNVTVIKGDSEIPRAFMHFPGAAEIVPKNFFDIEIKDFDLFIILDSAESFIISRFKPIIFPLPIRSIVIDHHATNPSYADLNLVESSYPATCQVLFDLFKEWDIRLNPEISSNLFIGLYADTGGFKYPGVSVRSFSIAAELVRHIPDVSRLVSRMESSNTPGFLAFESAALGSIEIFKEIFAIATVTNKELQARNIAATESKTSEVASFLLSVPEWKITSCGIEIEANKSKFSFRSADQNTYDVSELAKLVGGGGHRAAAGAVINMPIAEAKRLVVSKAQELYNL